MKVARAIFVLAAMVSAPSTGETRVEGPVPIGNPGDWFDINEYPPDALKAGAEGRSVVLLLIDANGKPIGCSVSISSGVASLDAATCRLGMTRGFFQPARDRKGKPISGKYTMPVTWHIPEDHLDRPMEVKNLAPERYEMMAIVEIDYNGKVSSCQNQPTLTDSPQGLCLSYPAKKQVMPPPRRDGRPVNAQQTLRLTIETTYDR